MLKVKGRINELVPYKPGKTIEEIKEKYKLKDIIKLGSNENSFGTSIKAIEAIKEYLNQTNIYPDGSCNRLKKKLAEKLKVNHESIVITNGSNEVIELIFKAFITEEDEVLCCYPTFSFYKICAMTTGCNFIDIPLKDFKFDLDSLLNSVNNKTRAIIICNPNNPTGTIVTQESLRNFIKKLPQNILLIIDEAYIEFVESDRDLNGIDLIKEFDNRNIVILRTFSKIFGLSALRIGYSVSNKEIANIFNKVRQPFNVNGFAQVAAIAALDDNDFLDSTLQGIKEGKEYIYNEFDKLGLFYLKSDTNFIFFKLNFDNDFIFEKFLKKGIIIRSLKSFGYENELRVTVGTMEQNKKFIKALKEILNEA